MKKLLFPLAALVVVLIIVMVKVLVVMWLWNLVVPSVTNLPQIGFWQSLGLIVLVNLVIGSQVKKDKK